MDKTKKYLAFSFVMVLVAVTIVSVIGMILLDRKPVVLQGQIEATEIRISGKLPGRIDRFLVEEGERVAAGDTLVVINSPEALAKYEQVQALEDVAVYQNQKIDDGTRRQIVESMKQLWVKAKADLKLARTTRERIESLYRDSVVTSRRCDVTRRKRFIRMRWPASGLPTSSTEWLWTGPGNKTARAPARWSTWLAEPWAR